ncbi:MAG TPA: glycosyltransferase family 4 protein [Gemmatimonadaceae bacterium]|nr:glycosyltransferase family 4 protein [Gemmatimonadaceae bacterium]
MSDAFSVAHVVAPAEFGGLESVLQLLTRSQRARGHAAHVIAVVPTANGAAACLDALEHGGATVTRIVSPGRHYVREWRTLRDAIARLSPDVVHTHGYRADVLAGDAARRLSTPIVSTVHGFTGGDWKNRLFESLQCRAFRRFDGVVAVSRPMRDVLAARGVGDERLHVVPNAYATDQPALDASASRNILGIDEQEYCIGWVGRLSFEKGADVMLSALAQPALRGATLAIVGDGPERSRLEALAHTLGVAKRVHWCGPRRDARRLLRAFDCVALSSRTEGTPMVLLEAMSAGVPLVATRVGGIPDVVDDGCAHLVPAESPEKLAAAIAALRGNADDTACRAAKASQRVRHRYSIEQWVADYDDVYRGAMRGSSRMAS